MKYEIDIPEEIDFALMKHAVATGKNVVKLIQHAVVSFANHDASPPRARRRPDLALEVVEISAPCELPRSSVRPIAIERISKRRPDPIAELA
ncbi:MAG: hypothetical protein O3A00_16770 [Planctomycetota bacterium]|nr:hypothetical protein [Planctomycetota bacterium]